MKSTKLWWVVMSTVGLAVVLSIWSYIKFNADQYTNAVQSVQAATQSETTSGVELSSLVQMGPVVISSAAGSLPYLSGPGLAKLEAAAQTASVELKNISGKNVVVLCVAWSTVDSTCSNGHCPGAYSTWGIYRTPSRSYVYPLSAGETKPFNRKFLQSLKAAPLKASIDAIMFEDGTVWGKNAHGAIEKFQHDLAIGKSTATGILEMLINEGADKVKAWLEAEQKEQNSKYMHPKWIGK